MRCAVMGAGAVGGFFGSKLALAGHEVHFIARGEHLQAMRNDGLVVRSTEGEWHVKVAATHDPADVGPVDLVLFCVKNYDLEGASRQLNPLIGPNTVIIPLQNGVDSPDYLYDLYHQSTLGGSCHIETWIAKPGLVAHTSNFAYLTFGELHPDQDRTGHLKAVLEEANIHVKVAPDIRRALWEKFIYLTTLSGLTTLTGLPIGALRDQPKTWSLIEQMVYEITALGRTEGVNLASDQEVRTLERFRTLHAGMRSSMARDRERGKRLEVEAIQGAVVRRSKQYGMPAPATAVVYSLLQPFVNGQAETKTGASPLAVTNPKP